LKYIEFEAELYQLQFVPGLFWLALGIWPQAILPESSRLIRILGATEAFRLGGTRERSSEAAPALADTVNATATMKSFMIQPPGWEKGVRA
jgi:hypothetical protein